jgi:hypothetical protein
MKLENILPKMSKLYLNRVVSSFLKDVRIEDEEEMRAVILRNASEFQNAERIKRSLDFLEDPRDIEVANELILICLIQYPDYLAPASQLIDDVMALQEQIVSDGLDDEYLSRAIPEDSRRIYTEVLKAAWAKDNELNAHEKNVLEVLRKELGLTRRHHRLLESKIGRFPQNGNKPFPLRQIEDSIKDLQQKGILLRFRTDDSYYVIPEEIEKTVRYFRGGGAQDCCL